MFRHILHRALLLGDEKNYAGTDNRFFLTDVLYLSLFLENFVLQPKLIVKEIPNIKIVDSPLIVDNYYQYSLRTKTLLPVYVEDFDEFDLDDLYYPQEIEYDDSILSLRLQNNPIIHSLGKEDFSIDTPNIAAAFQEVLDLGTKLENEELDFDFYTAMSLSEIIYALKKGLSLVPDKTNQTKIALNHSNHKNADLTNLLINTYNQIEKKANDDLKKLVQAGNNKKIFLPPITSIIFNEAKDESELMKIAFELRDEFKGLRNAFNGYENTLKDDSLSIKKSLEALNELEYFTSEMTKNYKARTSANITEWRDMSNFLRIMDGAVDAADSSSIAGMLLGKPLEYLGKKIKTRKVSYLFD